MTGDYDASYCHERSNGWSEFLWAETTGSKEKGRQIGTVGMQCNAMRVDRRKDKVD